VSISSDQYIKVWDLEKSTEEPLVQVSVPEIRMTSLTVSNDEEEKPAE